MCPCWTSRKPRGADVKRGPRLKLNAGSGGGLSKGGGMCVHVHVRVRRSINRYGPFNLLNPSYLFHDLLHQSNLFFSSISLISFELALLPAARALATHAHPAPRRPLEPQIQSLHLFGLSSKNMRYMMNYLSFTSFSGRWKKSKPIPRKLETKRDAGETEKRRQDVRGRPPPVLSPLVNLSLLLQSSSLFFWLCSCKAFGVFSPRRAEADAALRPGRPRTQELLCEGNLLLCHT